MSYRVLSGSPTIMKTNCCTEYMYYSYIDCMCDALKILVEFMLVIGLFNAAK